jgi:hypothetical protein
MKTTIKTFLLLLLISSSGSVFAQPCLQISKQIDACRATMEKNRINISKWEAEIRMNPRRSSLIQQHIHHAINEMNVTKTRKANLQKEYKECLAENNLAKTKYENQAKSSKTKTNYDDNRRLQKASESDEVIAAAKIKMEQNKKIKQNNKVDKLVDETMGSTSIAKKKVEYTAAEKLAKQKIKKEEAAKQKNIKSANTIKASESKEVIASTKAKMAENAKIKKDNAIRKGMHDLHGEGNFVPKQKVQLTEAEKLAKAKIKQDNRNAESRALNESAAVIAWKAEFKTTKTHTLMHTLNTIQLYSEFEHYLKTKFFTEENLYFYKTSKQTPASWNLRVIRSTYLTPKATGAISEFAEKKDFTINIAAASIQQLNNAILASNFVATPEVIGLMGMAQKEVLIMLGASTGPYYFFKQIMDGKANPPKKSRFSKR